MARARNIKPGFFANELLVELPFETRLLFIGLWTEADREGRLEDRPKRIKMALFPADNVDINAMLADLERMGFIRRYNAGGTAAIQIVNWSKHQNPHHTEKKSEISPEGTESTTGSSPLAHGEASVGQQEQDGGNLADSLIPDSLIPDSGFTDSQIPEQPVAEAAPASVPAADTQEPSPAKRKIPRKSSSTKLPDGFEISEAVRAWAKEQGHAQHLQTHFEHFVGVAIAKGYTYANWDQALMNAIRANWAKVGLTAPAAARSVHPRQAENERRKADFLRIVGHEFDHNTIDMEPAHAIR